jgi:hypothetical protein
MSKIVAIKEKPSKKIPTRDIEVEITTPVPRISVREYMRNFKLYNEKVMNGASFIIAKNDVDQVMLSVPPSEKKYTLKDIFKIKPYTGKVDPHLCEHIDSIVYGI